MIYNECMEVLQASLSRRRFIRDQRERERGSIEIAQRDTADST
jgi:hypothetical protein